MKLSVIIPVHNVEYIIRDCLDSILSQEYKDYEVILVENGSSDDSYNICKEYAKKDSRVMVYDIGPCNGPSKARNYAIDHSNGDAFIFLDSDDVVGNGFFAETNEKLSIGNDVVFIGYKRVNKDREVIEIVKPVLSAKDTILKCVELHNQDCFGYVSAKAARREIVGNVRFDETLNLFEDELFTLEIIQKDTKIDVLEGVYLEYLIEDNSLTTSFHPDMVSKKEKLYIAWKKFLKDYPERINKLCETNIRFCSEYIYQFEDRREALSELKRTEIYKDYKKYKIKYCIPMSFIKKDIRKIVKR